VQSSITTLRLGSSRVRSFTERADLGVARRDEVRVRGDFKPTFYVSVKVFKEKLPGRPTWQETLLTIRKREVPAAANLGRQDSKLHLPAQNQEKGGHVLHGKLSRVSTVNNHRTRHLLLFL